MMLMKMINATMLRLEESRVSMVSRRENATLVSQVEDDVDGVGERRCNHNVDHGISSM